MVGQLHPQPASADYAGQYVEFEPYQPAPRAAPREARQRPRVSCSYTARQVTEGFCMACIKAGGGGGIKRRGCVLVVGLDVVNLEGWEGRANLPGHPR